LHVHRPPLAHVGLSDAGPPRRCRARRAVADGGRAAGATDETQGFMKALVGVTTAFSASR
jgi:hypothetical protein